MLFDPTLTHDIESLSFFESLSHIQSYFHHRYNNLNAVFLFIPAMLYFGEHEQLSSPELVRASFWSLMTLSGIFGNVHAFLT